MKFGPRPSIWTTLGAVLLVSSPARATDASLAEDLIAIRQCDQKTCSFALEGTELLITLNKADGEHLVTAKKGSSREYGVYWNSKIGCLVVVADGDQASIRARDGKVSAGLRCDGPSSK